MILFIIVLITVCVCFEKLFEVSSTPSQAEIPFARVNHNKYMVTDKTALIGTSNWAGDYFLSTGGASLVMKQSTANETIKDRIIPENMSRGSNIVQQLQDVFDRDWYSAYAKPLYYYIGREKVMKLGEDNTEPMDFSDPAIGRAWPKYIHSQSKEQHL